MRSRITVVLGGLGLAFLFGCGESPTEVCDDCPVSFTVRVELGGFPIDQVVVEVTGPGIESPLVFNLTLTENLASGTITIPAGSDRTVVVTAFDAGGVATHRGSVTIAVEEGANPNLSVTLEALQGEQPIEARIGTLFVIVEPSADTLNIGDTLRLAATVVGAENDTLDVQVRWATLNPVLAWVDTAGLVTALSAGEVGVVATYAGVGGEASLLVVDPDAPLGFFSEVLAGGGTGSGGGADHTCALAADGLAYCWGENTFGELGSSDSTFSSIPLPVAGGVEFASLSVGGMHNCGIGSSGDVLCWGYNIYGQIGDDTQVSQFAPVSILGSLNLVAISAGGFSSCGFDASGQGFCWGWGGSGERADGVISETQTTPVGPMSISLDYVSVGAYHVCGLLADGTAYCWGRNSDGELGIAGATNDTCPDSTQCQTLPAAVNTAIKFSVIDPGGLWRSQEHTCALDMTGVAYCWGSNDFGQLGDGTTTARAVPTAVSGGLTFQAISTLGEFTCGVATDNTAYCWGRNDFGQLGDGSSNAFSSAPVAIGGTLRFLSVSVGSHHACGISLAGDAYCWGRNTEGALGDGTRMNRSVPTPVVVP